MSSDSSQAQLERNANIARANKLIREVQRASARDGKPLSRSAAQKLIVQAKQQADAERERVLGLVREAMPGWTRQPLAPVQPAQNDAVPKAKPAPAEIGPEHVFPRRERGDGNKIRVIAVRVDDNGNYTAPTLLINGKLMNT